MGYLRFCGALLAALSPLAPVAQAHEFFVVPSNWSPKAGESITATVLSTHVFLKTEELEAPEINSACVAQDQKKTPISLNADSAKLVHTGTATVAGDKSFVLCGVRAGLTTAITAEGSKRGTRKEFPDAKLVRTVEKFSKAIVNAGAGGDAWSKPIGDRVEIMLKSDPARIKAGDEVEVQVLYQGKPRPTNLWATYDGFSSRNQTFAYYTEMESADSGFVKITQPGVWIVRAEITDDTKTAEIDRYVGRAVLMFEVK